MSAIVFLRSVSVLVLACVLFGASPARACSETTQDVFLVGNTSTDAACNFSTIHDAVSAASCPAGTRIILTNEVAYNELVSITNQNISLIGRAPGAKCGSLSAVC